MIQMASVAYDGGGIGKGGMGTLLVNGKKVASGRIEQTQCCIFSADEGPPLLGAQLGLFSDWFVTTYSPI